MTDYMVSGLVAKRAELAGEIERTHERLRQLVNDLGSIDATLRIVPPDLVAGAIRLKSVPPALRLEPTRPNAAARPVHPSAVERAADNPRDCGSDAPRARDGR